ncbi:receptor-like cytoplasmic kinase 176 [Bidens hawaiensis]|uniref:receptor-like cytoplasmic kinase 176 n=1 Tax=Bidens hawaiensis TaxID=980011 RepID=UPI00404A6B8B
MGSRLCVGRQASHSPSKGLKCFEYKSLKKATRNFHPNRVLVNGECGSFYEARIDKHLVYVAKKLDYPGPGKSDLEWLIEVNNFGQLNHPNLAKLIGFCIEGVHRFLVYEFLQGGSLENLLFPNTSNFQPLLWNLRIKIATGVAKGLEYLHSTTTNVRYHEFKSCNILIDSNYNPKLYDIGLKNTLNEGNCAYIGIFAPEDAMIGVWTRRCEIYGFEVVLLELLTGRRCIDKNLGMQGNLPRFANPFLKSKENTLVMMDPRIEGQYSSVAATRAALLAKKCISDKPEMRPNADELVTELEQIQELQKSFKNSSNK